MYSRYTENEAESIVDHLKSIADMMERKFGLIEANLKKVDDGFQKKFLAQEKQFKEAKKSGDGKMILDKGRAMIRAWKALDQALVESGVQHVPATVWVTKHQGREKVQINVVQDLKDMPATWADNEAWISLEALVNCLPVAVIETKCKFPGSLIAGLEDYFDDDIPF
tara:strand:+ start:416 stop:916 length:501 start_codon:yes stop_codon:yes gene_type:complete